MTDTISLERSLGRSLLPPARSTALPAQSEPTPGGISPGGISPGGVASAAADGREVVQRAALARDADGQTPRRAPDAPVYKPVKCAVECAVEASDGHRGHGHGHGHGHGVQP